MSINITLIYNFGLSLMYCGTLNFNMKNVSHTAIIEYNRHICYGGAFELLLNRSLCQFVYFVIL